jgi:hypothetical protein
MTKAYCKRRNSVDTVKVLGAFTIFTYAFKSSNIETSKKFRKPYILTMGVHSRFSVHVANYNCMDVPVTSQQSVNDSESYSYAIRMSSYSDYIESIVKLCAPYFLNRL